MKKLLTAMMAGAAALSLSACGGTTAATTAAADTTAPAAETTTTAEAGTDTQAAADTAAAQAANGEKIEIGVLIKGTDSDFWQQVLVGAKNFAVDNPGVNITAYGPTSEADSAQQTEILDNLVTTKPDGIVIAPTLKDNCSAGIDAAMSQGIPVVIVDNQPSTDHYVTMYATDAYAAGGMVAEKFLGELEARGMEKKGVVGLISPMAGQDTVIKRESGFKDKLAKLAPDITVLEPIYCDNDIPTALAAAENIYTANQDKLIGYFASNNATGDGLSQFMSENKMGDKIVAVAFDSDEAEINAVREGALYCTAVQNPYQMGYQGCQAVYDVITGAKTAADFKKFNDTGVSLIDKNNVDNPDMKGIIDPFSLKKY